MNGTINYVILTFYNFSNYVTVKLAHFSNIQVNNVSLQSLNWKRYFKIFCCGIDVAYYWKLSLDVCSHNLNLLYLT